METLCDTVNYVTMLMKIKQPWSHVSVCSLVVTCDLHTLYSVVHVSFMTSVGYMYVIFCRVP